MRGKARASLILAVDDIRRRGCAAAGVRLAGPDVSAIRGLDLYGAWRLLTTFEEADRCVLLMAAEHTRTASPYQLLYDALGIPAPAEPRTKPGCCDPDGQPPIDPDLARRFEDGLRQISQGTARAAGRSRGKRG